MAGTRLSWLEERHDASAFAVVAGHHHRGQRDVRMAAEDALYFVRFDAMPPYLDLTIVASPQFQPAIGAPPGQVTGPVESAAFAGRVRATPTPPM